MAISITGSNIDRVDFTGATLRVFGHFSPTGNYTTGGDACSLAGIDAIKASSAPDVVTFTSMTSSVRTAAYNYTYLKGATPTLANGKMQAWGASAGASGSGEHANGAYNANVTNDVIYFEAVWFNRDI